MTYPEFADKLNKLLLDDKYENFDIVSNSDYIELYVTTTDQKIDGSKLIFLEMNLSMDMEAKYFRWLSQWKIEHIRDALQLSIDCDMFTPEKIILIMQQMIEKVLKNENWANLGAKL